MSITGRLTFQRWREHGRNIGDGRSGRPDGLTTIMTLWNRPTEFRLGLQPCHAVGAGAGPGAGAGAAAAHRAGGSS